MHENEKTTKEIIDIVADIATKIGQIGLVCIVLSVLVNFGY